MVVFSKTHQLQLMVVCFFQLDECYVGMYMIDVVRNGPPAYALMGSFWPVVLPKTQGCIGYDLDCFLVAGQGTIESDFVIGKS